MFLKPKKRKLLVSWAQLLINLYTYSFFFLSLLSNLLFLCMLDRITAPDRFRNASVLREVKFNSGSSNSAMWIFLVGNSFYLFGDVLYPLWLHYPLVPQSTMLLTLT